LQTYPSTPTTPINGEQKEKHHKCLKPHTAGAQPTCPLQKRMRTLSQNDRAHARPTNQNHRAHLRMHENDRWAGGGPEGPAVGRGAVGSWGPWGGAGAVGPVGPWARGPHGPCGPHGPHRSHGPHAPHSPHMYICIYIYICLYMFFICFCYMFLLYVHMFLFFFSRISVFLYVIEVNCVLPEGCALQTTSGQLSEAKYNTKNSGIGFGQLLCLGLWPF